MMNKRAVFYFISLFLFCFIILKYRHSCKDVERLKSETNILSIFYEKTRSIYFISKIPLFLQEEKFVKNCNDVKCVSEGESFSGKEYKISIEFEINKNGTNFSGAKIADAVRDFISNEMQEMIYITKKTTVNLKESNKVYYDSSYLLSVNVIISKK